MRNKVECSKSKSNQYIYINGCMEETVTFIGVTLRPSDVCVCFISPCILRKPGHADWESFLVLQRKPKVRKRLWEGKPGFHCGRPTFTGSQSPQREKWHKIWKPGLKRSTESGFRWTRKRDLNGSKYGYFGCVKSFLPVFVDILLWDALIADQFLTHYLHWKCSDTFRGKHFHSFIMTVSLKCSRFDSSHFTFLQFDTVGQKEKQVSVVMRRAAVLWIRFYCAWWQLCQCLHKQKHTEIQVCGRMLYRRSSSMSLRD